mmetsp:Transcript_19920/g.63331  ORF Transcript_19920/g.63331 Transcript_19920/m.63331 type:complete len:233 (-) Transcript_19920:1885-2583(-)
MAIAVTMRREMTASEQRPVASERESGSSWSTESRSELKRLRMRPCGVVWKKLSGARSTLCSMLSCSPREARVVIENQPKLRARQNAEDTSTRVPNTAKNSDTESSDAAVPALPALASSAPASQRPCAWSRGAAQPATAACPAHAPGTPMPLPPQVGSSGRGAPTLSSPHPATVAAAIDPTVALPAAEGAALRPTSLPEAYARYRSSPTDVASNSSASSSSSARRAGLAPWRK